MISPFVHPVGFTDAVKAAAHLHPVLSTDARYGSDEWLTMSSPSCHQNEYSSVLGQANLSARTYWTAAATGCCQAASMRVRRCQGL
jgi:hypothetical protein